MQKLLSLIAKSFKDDPSKMIFITGIIGWISSSAAQVIAILVNKNIPNDQKSFLLTQEISDAAINILAFATITKLCRTFSHKLVTTGKLLPNSVKEFLTKNKLGDKIGKIDFNIDSLAELAKDSQVFNDYTKFKTLTTSSAALAGSIFSSNIVAPYARNKIAADVQKNYKELEKNEIIPKQEVKNPYQTYPTTYNPYQNSSGLKI